MFPDQHLINNPYKIMLAQGEWTCTITDFTGTMTGAMKMPDGTVIQPTNKRFHIDFCTVARSRRALTDLHRNRGSRRWIE